MKIIFFGTSELGIPSLKKLVEIGYKDVTVVTPPDRPAGRKQILQLSPIKRAAEELGLKILQPPSLPKTWGGIEGEVDLFVVASYGQIIPKNILNIPKYGALNIHPSLLPKYRGPSPVPETILNGDTETGVTIIKMDEQMDHGPIVAQTKYKIGKKRLTYRDLHHEILAEVGAELLIKILPDYIAGKIKPEPQDDSKATFTKIISKDDARIDWSKSAEQIDRMVRAYSEWPVAWTTLDGKRLKIFEAIPVKPSLPLEGGGKVGVTDGKLIISTGSGQLEILSLQLQSSRKMSAKEFTNGYPHLSGKTLK